MVSKMATTRKLSSVVVHNECWVGARVMFAPVDSFFPSACVSWLATSFRAS